MLARGEYPALAAKGVTLVRGDVTDVHACLKACEGAEAVFHVAALASVSVRLEPYVRTNIDGTRTLLGAAKAAGVRRFVYTSTPSVVFSPTGHVGSNEAEPLTTQTMSPYAFTKARAEEHVLAANEPAFRTLALRPHLVWGPGDTQLTAKLVERAQRGRLRLVGDGHEKVDTTYIGNCVDAHLLAERALEQGRGVGKAYFISNGEPLAVRDFVDKVLDAYGVQATARSVPMCNRHHQFV